MSKEDSAKAAGSPEAVALQLCDRIASDQIGREVPTERQQDPKAYWISLYRHCLKVVKGFPAAEALEED